MYFGIIVGAALLMAGCATQPAAPERVLGRSDIGVIYESPEYQLTGVAVSRAARVFVNFPRWAGPYRMGVGEVTSPGTIKAYPDETWNAFSEDPKMPPAGDHWVCVQSVHVDGRDRLWVLDTASPRLEGVVRPDAARGVGGGGPKLVEIDLATNAVKRIIRFDDTVCPANCYLNDVRVELLETGDVGYITDSGAGAIIVVDLNTNTARRLLADHPSTKADASLLPIIGGRQLRGPDGKVPQVHSDGIALDHRRGWLYWQALTGKRLYRIETELLRDASMSAAALGAAVTDLGESVMADGLECDKDGVLYFTALENDAVVVRMPDGTRHTLARDTIIAWPDSFALAEGHMPGQPSSAREPLVIFTTAQIHQTPMFNSGAAWPTEPFRVLVVPAVRRK